MSVYDELTEKNIWGSERKRLAPQTSKELSNLKEQGGGAMKTTPTSRKRAEDLMRKNVETMRRRGSQKPVTGMGTPLPPKTDSTEYEGPSLREQVEFIKTFLEQQQKPREKKKQPPVKPYTEGPRFEKIKDLRRRDDKGREMGPLGY
jgi:hypothetical protein